MISKMDFEKIFREEILLKKFVAAFLAIMFIFVGNQNVYAKDQWVASENGFDYHVVTETFNQYYDASGFEVVVKIVHPSKGWNAWLFYFNKSQSDGEWYVSGRELDFDPKNPKYMKYTGRKMQRRYVTDSSLRAFSKMFNYCMDNLYRY